MNIETYPAVTADLILQQARLLADSEANCWLLVYKDESFQAGIVRQDRIQLGDGAYDPAHLDELRLFSPEGEWHVWRDGPDLLGRTIRRADENPEQFREQALLLVGGTLQSRDASTFLADPATGCRWSLPSEAFGRPLAAADLPLVLRVRNHYAFDAFGRLQFTDARLVAIEPRNRKGA